MKKLEVQALIGTLLFTAAVIGGACTAPGSVSPTAPSLEAPTNSSSSLTGTEDGERIAAQLELGGPSGVVHLTCETAGSSEILDASFNPLGVRYSPGLAVRFLVSFCSGLGGHPSNVDVVIND